MTQVQDGAQQQQVASLAKGLSDTPWLSDEVEQTNVEPERLSVTRQPEREAVTQQPEREIVSQQSYGASFNGTAAGGQDNGFTGRAGRLPEEPQGRGFGQQPQSPERRFEEQPQARAVGQQPQSSRSMSGGNQGFEQERQSSGGVQQVDSL